MELIFNASMKTALKFLQAAVTADCQKEYKTAVVNYMEGAPQLLQLAKTEGLTLQAKQLLKTKCQQYLDRIQLVKSHLDAGEDVPPISAVDRAHPCTDSLNEEFLNFCKCLSYFPGEIGMDEFKGAVLTKDFLKKNVVLPLMFPGLPDSVMRVKKGILLYGLPGSGKTLLLSAVAAAVSCPCFRIGSWDLTTNKQGEENAVQRVKDLFSFVSQNAPCILCLDDLEGLYPSNTMSNLAANVREELNLQLMALSADTKVTVMAATHKPWVLGGMIRRRFERRFYLTLPSASERVQIFTQELATTNHSLSESDLECVGHMTSGYTGSDLVTVARSCNMVGLRLLQTATHFCKVLFEEKGGKTSQEMMMPCEPDTHGAVEITWEFLNPDRVQLPPLTMPMVEKELKKCLPSCSESEMNRMNQFHEEFGQEK